MEFLKGNRTYIVAGLMVLVALVRLVTGEIDITSFLFSPDLNLLLTGLGLGALRAAVK